MSSPEFIVLPKAGKPTSKRAVIPVPVHSQAERVRTSCPGLLVAISPLLPEPFALKLNRAISWLKQRSR